MAWCPSGAQHEAISERFATRAAGGYDGTEMFGETASSAAGFFLNCRAAVIVGIRCGPRGLQDTACQLLVARKVAVWQNQARPGPVISKGSGSLINAGALVGLSSLGLNAASGLLCWPRGGVGSLSMSTIHDVRPVCTGKLNTGKGVTFHNASSGI
ncbi:unnamed protein product [Clonostachys chloroleuca]|uniref:Uncharacterized protein n=1 Tax=Clonostachys chloroleuca TaxID=1926264 RepID=A0AA35MDI2_9HYPO|nr:unnamed protein product [Clonostachys chloroleuca]